jgi:hypothetical protein
MQHQTEIADITEFWETEIDAALEAGRRPLLFIGQSATTLGMLPGLLTLEALAARRADASAPRAALAGTTPFWLSPLMQPAPPDRVHPIQPIYLGPDTATIMASSNLIMGQGVQTNLRPVAPLPGNVPPGFAPGVLPLTRPAEPVLWNALPFTRIRVEHARPGIDGTAFAALFLAAALIVFALLL